MSESACGDGERNGQLFLCIIRTQLVVPGAYERRVCGAHKLLVVLTEVVGVYTGK